MDAFASWSLMLIVTIKYVVVAMRAAMSVSWKSISPRNVATVSATWLAGSARSIAITSSDETAPITVKPTERGNLRKR